MARPAGLQGRATGSLNPRTTPPSTSARHLPPVGTPRPIAVCHGRIPGCSSAGQSGDAHVDPDLGLRHRVLVRTDCQAVRGRPLPPRSDPDSPRGMRHELTINCGAGPPPCWLPGKPARVRKRSVHIMVEDPPHRPRLESLFRLSTMPYRWQQAGRSCGLRRPPGACRREWRW